MLGCLMLLLALAWAVRKLLHAFESWHVFWSFATLDNYPQPFAQSIPNPLTYHNLTLALTLTLTINLTYGDVPGWGQMCTDPRVWKKS